MTAASIPLANPLQTVPALSILELLVGFLVGLLGSVGLYFLQRIEKRRNMRYSLYAEIGTMFPIGETTAAIGTLPSHTTVQTRMYETCSENLGLLSADETKAVVQYYDLLSVYEEQLRTLNESPTSEALVEYFNGVTVPRVARNQEDAIESLVRNAEALQSGNVLYLESIDRPAVGTDLPFDVADPWNTRGIEEFDLPGSSTDGESVYYLRDHDPEDVLAVFLERNRQSLDRSGTERFVERVRNDRPEWGDAAERVVAADERASPSVPELRS